MTVYIEPAEDIEGQYPKHPKSQHIRLEAMTTSRCPQGNRTPQETMHDDNELRPYALELKCSQCDVRYKGFQIFSYFVMTILQTFMKKAQTDNVHVIQPQVITMRIRLLSKELRTAQEALRPGTLMLGKCGLCEYHTTILVAPPTPFGLCCVECYQSLLDDQIIYQPSESEPSSMHEVTIPHRNTQAIADRPPKRARIDDSDRQPRQSHQLPLFDAHTSGWHANQNTAVVHRNVWCQQQRAAPYRITEVKACVLCTPIGTLVKGVRVGVAKGLMHQNLTCGTFTRDVASGNSSASTTPSTSTSERHICGICGS